MQISSDLAGQKPNKQLSKEISRKTGVLKRIIEEIEQETKVGYPPTRIVHALIFDKKEGIIRGISKLEPSLTNKGKVEQIVCISAFTLFSFDPDTITGVLVEEFLHYAYKTKLILRGTPLTRQPDKTMQEPLNDWFREPRFAKCYALAQQISSAGEAKKKVESWTQKGYPTISLDYYSEPLGRLDFLVPADIAKALRDKNKLRT